MINRPWRKSEPQAIILPDRAGGVLQSSSSAAVVRRSVLPGALTLPGARACGCGTMPADPYARFCGQCGKRL